MLMKGLVCADHSCRETRLDGNEKKTSDAGLASNLAPSWLCAGQLHVHGRLRQSQADHFVSIALNGRFRTLGGAVPANSNKCLRAPPSAALLLVRVAQRHWGRIRLGGPGISFPLETPSTTTPAQEYTTSPSAESIQHRISAVEPSLWRLQASSIWSPSKRSSSGRIPKHRSVAPPLRKAIPQLTPI